MLVLTSSISPASNALRTDAERMGKGWEMMAEGM
jgi:hypothetical protein